MEPTQEVKGPVVQVDAESVSTLSSEKAGTSDDVRDMFRMGKFQEMKRNFRFLSIFGFAMVLMCSWETALGTSFLALYNGGTAGFIWMHLVTWVGFLCIYTVMGDMGSMAPTPGGQYHWVSEFAPPQYQKFLSFIIGWLCVLGWQTGAANTALLSGLQIQGLLVLNYPTYQWQPYHGTLLCFAVITVSVIFNTLLVKKLPLIEKFVLAVHVIGFFAIMITLWVHGPKNNAAQVFTQFNNYGNWNSFGTSALVGITGVIIPLLGADSIVHMGEEIRDASKNIPRVMILSPILNGLMAFIMIITFCMRMQSLDDVLFGRTGQPYIAVFYNATGSVAATNAMSAVVIFQQIFCNLSIVATASRQLFAFARDKGMPFYRWFAYVRPGWDVPINAILVSWLVTCLLALINIGSSVAFNNIGSLSVSGVMASYVVSIGCITWKRFKNEPVLPSKLNLGRMTGLILGVISLAFVLFFFVLAMFPPAVHPNVQQMNWCVVMFVGVVGFALVYYWAGARNVYAGPVEYVRKGV